VDLPDLVAAVKPWVRFILGHRLVHFAVLGGALFAVAPAPASSRRVALSSEYLSSLHAAQAARLGVGQLSREAGDEVDRRAIEDEVLYREALRLGLDRDDSIVRQHLIQKTLLLAEDLAGASREASEGEVQKYFEIHADRYRRAREERFIHVFATRRETLVSLALAVRAAEEKQPGVAPSLGDAFPRLRDVRGGQDDVAASFGDAFAGEVFEMPVGAWGEPVESRFGWHLVKVIERSEGRPATFEEAEGRARLDLAVDRRHEAIARFVDRALARYDVEVGGARITSHVATPRLAMRGSPSGED
jgi:peptidyl-prolyl cis-trans isomerase C